MYTIECSVFLALSILVVYSTYIRDSNGAQSSFLIIDIVLRQQIIATSHRDVDAETDRGDPMTHPLVLE